MSAATRQFGRRLLVTLLMATVASPQTFGSGLQTSSRVVDRIVARVESDIITLSEVRQLGAFQQMVDGRAESDERLLARLIEQWVIRTEAEASRFPHPTEAEVSRELTRLAGQFPTEEAFALRLRELGLSRESARELILQQIFLGRYLDSKFRSAVQIDSAAIEKYYQDELLPAVKTKGQPAPDLSDVSAQIRELLTQRDISDRAARWLDETKSRLRLETTLSEKTP